MYFKMYMYKTQNKYSILSSILFIAVLNFFHENKVSQTHRKFRVLYKYMIVRI